MVKMQFVGQLLSFTYVNMAFWGCLGEIWGLNIKVRPKWLFLNGEISGTNHSDKCFSQIGERKVYRWFLIFCQIYAISHDLLKS